MAKGTLKISSADAFTAADLAPNSVDSSELVDGSVDLSHMSVNSIDSDQYVDGSIDLAHMSVNSIDSDQYVDGSIDTAHIGNLQVTAAKVAADVATQAELDARVSAATTAAQGVGTGDTPKFDIIKTKANNYAYSKGVELSSKGMFQQNFHGVAANLVASAISQYSGGWTEISGGNFNGWEEDFSSDIFGTFNAANGRFTPTVAGYVLCTAAIRINVTAGQHLAVGFVRNGSMNNTSGYTIVRVSPNNNDTDYGSLSHIMYCDSDDYLSCWTYNTESNTRVIPTESWVSYAYLGGTL